MVYFYNIQIPRKTVHLLFQILCLLFEGFCFAIIVTSLMKIKLKAMKKIVFTFISFLIDHILYLILVVFLGCFVVVLSVLLNNSIIGRILFHGF